MERQGIGGSEGIKGKKIEKERTIELSIKKFSQCRGEVKLRFREESRHQGFGTSEGIKGRKTKKTKCN
jgi:hypothetical protein